MPIRFIPAAGDVLMCEFGPDPASITTQGVKKGPLAVPPEIFKLRPIAVLSSFSNISIVVPFSTAAPNFPKPYHIHFPVGAYPFLSQSKDSWLKADLIESVSHARLDRCMVDGIYRRVRISENHLKRLREACLNAMQMGHLVKYF